MLDPRHPLFPARRRRTFPRGTRNIERRGPASPGLDTFHAFRWWDSDGEPTHREILLPCSNPVRPGDSIILIADDSSDDAKAAIQHAGRLMRGQTVIVLSIWEPFMTMISRAPAGLGPISDMSDIEGIDETLRRTAERHAQEGAQLARAAGLDASARVASRSGSVAEAILAAAEETGAAAIVLGSRGLTGLKSMMLGSVSHAIIQHADRPVLVVPSPAVAEHRQQHTRSREEQTN